MLMTSLWSWFAFYPRHRLHASWGAHFLLFPLHHWLTPFFTGCCISTSRSPRESCDCRSFDWSQPGFIILAPHHISVVLMSNDLKIGFIPHLAVSLFNKRLVFLSDQVLLLSKTFGVIEEVFLLGTRACITFSSHEVCWVFFFFEQIFFFFYSPNLAFEA